MLKYFLLLWLLFMSGCATLQKLAGQIETVGEIGEQAGAVITLTAPEIGVIVVAGSGILLAVAKLLEVL